MIIIVYETHATSLDNEDGRASGHYDVALSRQGEQQARELGRRHRGETIDAIFCSDLQRAYRTAELAFPDGDVPIIRDARLRECNYGDWTRRPKDYVFADALRWVRIPFPNGESYEQVTARVKRFLDDLLRDYDGKRVIIIGHLVTHYALEHLLNGRSLAELVSERWSWQPGWSYHLKGNELP